MCRTDYRRSGTWVIRPVSQRKGSDSQGRPKRSHAALLFQKAAVDASLPLTMLLHLHSRVGSPSSVKGWSRPSPLLLRCGPSSPVCSPAQPPGSLACPLCVASLGHFVAHSHGAAPSDPLAPSAICLSRWHPAISDGPA